MKKHLQSLVFSVIILLSFNLFSQDFVRVSIDNSGEVLKLNTNQVLEVNLPSIPSTGYGWYVKDATRLASCPRKFSVFNPFCIVCWKCCHWLSLVAPNVKVFMKLWQLKNVSSNQPQKQKSDLLSNA